jgi:hypothetical protein
LEGFIVPVMMSSAVELSKTFRASRKRFRARPKTVRLPVGITVRLQPGIPFAFTPESFSRSPRNPFRLAPESAGYTGRSTSGKRSLGNLYDTSIEYRANRRLTLTSYFGYTQGLSAMQQIYPGGKDGKFGYLEALLRF